MKSLQSTKNIQFKGITKIKKIINSKLMKKKSKVATVKKTISTKSAELNSTNFSLKDWQKTLSEKPWICEDYGESSYKS